MSALSLAAAALLLWRCAATERPAATPPASSRAREPSESGLSQVAAPPSHGAETKPAMAPGDPAATSSRPAPSGSAGATSSGAAAIVAAVGQRDPRDLALLSRIERELKRDPPQSVHALLRLRERGATRAELLSSAAQLPAGDLPLRVLVLRWIDEVRPDPSAPQAAPPSPAPHASHRQLIKPIERVNAP